MVFWRVRDGRITGRWAEIDFGGLIAQLTASARAA
jgi:predicted ester cyclase